MISRRFKLETYMGPMSNELTHGLFKPCGTFTQISLRLLVSKWDFRRQTNGRTDGQAILVLRPIGTAAR